jgi:hypothetical protein
MYNEAMARDGTARNQGPQCQLTQWCEATLRTAITSLRWREAESQRAVPSGLLATADAVPQTTLCQRRDEEVVRKRSVAATSEKQCEKR